MKKAVFSLLLCLAVSTSLMAQDTLPRFSVRNAGNNRFIIGWVNPFPNISQISIQRSFDSLGLYKTILSVADPKSQQNGYTDRSAPNDHMFYRLFYAMEGGAYFFTKAQRADTSKRVMLAATKVRPVIAGVDIPANYKDSIFIRNRDTLLVINRDTLRVVRPDTVIVKAKPLVPKWVPSSYVFTNYDGYVSIRLPDAAEKKYALKFYDGSEFLFEIKGVHEKMLLLDKANFYHSGWFQFELYNDDKLVEKNKFFLRP